MLDDAQKAEVAAILDQVPRLTLDDLETLGYDDVACNSLKLETDLPRLSAAGASWLAKMVREAVAPLLPLMRGTMLSWDWVQMLGSVEAVLGRGRLTVEQYEAHVRGLRVVGLAIPTHPSREGQVWADSQVGLTAVVRQDVQGYLAQMAELTGEDYRKIADLRYAAIEESKTARRLLMMPAADFRWLVGQVRTTFRPAGAVPPNEVAFRVKSTLRAVQQIVCRDRMTVKQYDALMEPYRAVGIHVPPHPQSEG